MKFMLTYQQNPKAPPPSMEKLKQLGEYTMKNIASGLVVLTGGLIRPTTGIKVKSEGGKFSVTDGPFAESKELIDGFAVVNVQSKEEAIAVAREFMGIAGDGEGEILQMFDGGGPPPTTR
jgi:hypothetical protein